jgi:hypothetical protein
VAVGVLAITRSTWRVVDEDGRQKDATGLVPGDGFFVRRAVNGALALLGPAMRTSSSFWTTSSSWRPWGVARKGGSKVGNSRRYV